MNATSTYSVKAFRFAILSIITLVVFVVIKQLVGNEKIPSDNYAYYSALNMFMVVLFSFVGFIFNMKGIKEPRSLKKMSSLIINSIFMVLFLVTTIMNVVDLINYSKGN